MMIGMEIPLRNREGDIVAKVIVDDDVPEEITKPRWYYNNGYAKRDGQKNGKRYHVLMHRFLAGVTEPGNKIHVDHINGDTLDNRRQNLRITTPSQNHQNRPVRTRRGTYRGVTWKRGKGKDGSGKWLARATINYKTHHIGYFDDEEEAAFAVAEWRRKHMTHSSHDEVTA